MLHLGILALDGRQLDGKTFDWKPPSNYWKVQTCRYRKSWIKWDIQISARSPGYFENGSV